MNKNKKERILYIMHIPWDSIKQRPHFIAEELNKLYDIKVIYPSLLKSKKNKILNDSSNISLSKVFELPLRGRLFFVRKLNEIFLFLYYKLTIIFYRPNFIWMCFPNHSQFVPENKKYKIIYDCMDDAPEFFFKNKVEKRRMLKKEKDLVSKSEIVFASSVNLKNILIRRYGNIHSKIHLVRNAFNGKIISDKSEKEGTSFPIKICYVGAIASWFDFESLAYCLNSNNNIEFHIIGPIHGDSGQFKHARMIYHGAINHEELPTYVEKYDALIMPFKINDLILSVDPVKLYEYINFNKPIFSIYYDEIKRFSNFVKFYNSKQELLQLLSNGDELLNKKYSHKARYDFLSDNTWQIRAVKIHEILTKEYRA
jgi:hypothetical protein